MFSRITGWFEPRTPPFDLNGIEVIDKRAKALPITMIPTGEDDPYTAIIISASFQSGEPVLGNIDGKGRLTLTDA